MGSLAPTRIPRGIDKVRGSRFRRALSPVLGRSRTRLKAWQRGAYRQQGRLPRQCSALAGDGRFAWLGERPGAYLTTWKVKFILSNMENMSGSPTPEEAADALADAEASRTTLALRLVVPSFFYISIGSAIAVQIATTAVGMANVDHQALLQPAVWLVISGCVAFAAVAAIQLIRFRRLNGLWLGGFASRVVGGTAMSASVSYVLTLGAAIWAAFEAAWWLVAVCSLAGGVAYAMSGRRWVRIYRGEPATHARGESAAWLAALAVLALVGLVFLMIGS